jgi:hypothetical protein
MTDEAESYLSAVKQYIGSVGGWLIWLVEILGLLEEVCVVTGVVFAVHLKRAATASKQAEGKRS